MKKLKLLEKLGMRWITNSEIEKKEWILKHHVNVRWKHPINEALNALTFDEMARALYIGYEVEEEFKHHDWVYVLEAGEIGRVDKNYLINGVVYVCYHNCYTKRYNPNEIRHATPEEIAEEKERRWWSSHGRGVWELREGDVLAKNIDGFPLVVTKDSTSDYVMLNFDVYSITSLKKSCEVLCFVENRLDGDY